ncbi:hypothetical protein PVL29_000817 [Vitis rotundifolia]|uniref:Uncharacterized protein n=1 Tax=Vitis rotundifolia TaxID=103349 RepID=A0AA39AM54_VITRO|nr:hypothetical protein PVL29_000817 [Vitis rotundifolia]
MTGTNIMWKELCFLDLIKEALKIPYKNTNFIIFSLFSSLPLTLAETIEILTLPPGYSYRWNWPVSTHIARRLTGGFFLKFVQLGLLYMLPLHLLEFFDSVVTVNLASKLQPEEKPMALRQMVRELFHKAKLKGPFITSVYVLLRSTCALLGLVWLFVNYYFISRRFWHEDYIEVNRFFFLMSLLTKYLDWSMEWNMSIVLSILEEPCGAEAFAVSSHFSRGSEKCGRLLVLVFLVWGLGLRLACLQARCNVRGSGILIQVMLLCMGNVVKWMVFMVYFHNCKKRILRKTIVGEVGVEDKTVNADFTHETETGKKVDKAAG